MAANKIMGLGFGKKVAWVLCFCYQSVVYSDTPPTPSSSFRLEETCIVDSSPEAQWLGYVGYDFDIDSNGTPCFVYYTTKNTLRLMMGLGAGEDLPLGDFMRGALALGRPLTTEGGMDLRQASNYQGWDMGVYVPSSFDPYSTGGQAPLPNGCAIATSSQGGYVAILAKVESDSWFAPLLRVWFRASSPPELTSKSIWYYEGGYPRSRCITFAPDNCNRLGAVCADIFYNWYHRAPRVRHAHYWEGVWKNIKAKAEIQLTGEIFLAGNLCHPEPQQIKIGMGNNGTTFVASMFVCGSLTSLVCTQYKDSFLTGNVLWFDTWTQWYHMDLAMQRDAYSQPCSAWLAVTNPHQTLLIDANATSSIPRVLDAIGGWSVGVATGPDNEPYIAVVYDEPYIGIVDTTAAVWLYYFIGNRDGSVSDLTDWIRKSLRCKCKLDFIKLPSLTNYHKGCDSVSLAQSAGSRTPPVLLKCKKDASGKYKLHFMWYGDDGRLHYAKGSMWWW